MKSLIGSLSIPYLTQRYNAWSKDYRLCITEEESGSSKVQLKLKHTVRGVPVAAQSCGRAVVWTSMEKDEVIRTVLRERIIRDLDPWELLEAFATARSMHRVRKQQMARKGYSNVLA